MKLLLYSLCRHCDDKNKYYNTVVATSVPMAATLVREGLCRIACQQYPGWLADPIYTSSTPDGTEWRETMYAMILVVRRQQATHYRAIQH